MKTILTALAVLVLLSAPAWAATRAVTLSVAGMTCSTCPLTVKLALSKLAGVQKVEASLEKQEATVTFDDMKTNVAELVKATANAGYPSTVKR